MTQTSLFAPLVSPAVPRTATPAERFAAFHAANPSVYRALVALAREAHRKDRRVGMRLLWERLRWEYTMNVSDGEYALNNIYAPFFSRLIMSREPDLDGYFETRERRAA